MGSPAFSYPGSPGIHYSDGGHLIALGRRTDENGSIISDGDFLWKLLGPGRTPGRLAIGLHDGGALDAGTYWGFSEASPGGTTGTKLMAGGSLVDTPAPVRNVVPDGNGGHVVSFEYGKTTQVLQQGLWKQSTLLADAVDCSEVGIAIGGTGSALSAPTLLNGKWAGIERSAPTEPGTFDPPEPWHDGSVSLQDVSPGGWGLARRGEVPYSYAAMLPIRVEGYYVKSDGTSATQAVGVDDFSIGSSDPGNTVAERIWIMAPQGGFNKIVKIKAPLSEDAGVQILASNITFPVEDTISLGSAVNPVVLRASDTVASGGERIMSMILGEGTAEIPSISKPIGLKIMKGRTVNVTVYKVTKLYGQSSEEPVDTVMMPSEEEMEDHLNDIFRPQINTLFQVTLVPTPLKVRWDAPPENGSFNVQIPTTDPPGEEGAILSKIPPNPPASDIRVFVMGNSGPLGMGADAYGLTDRDNAICWIHGTHWGRNKTKDFLLDTIAHEIGHVLVGYGHPDSKLADARGKAPLPGTRHACRLMCSGPNSGSGSRLLVKREWDEAEAWLNTKIDNPQP